MGLFEQDRMGYLFHKKLKESVILISNRVVVMLERLCTHGLRCIMGPS